MCACVTNCQTSHRENMKKQQRSHSEEMRLYWLFCATFKGHQWYIVEECDFTISLQFQRVGSKVNFTLAYHHWLCDFSFSNQKRNKAIEGRVMESEEKMTVLDSLLSDIHDSWSWSVTRTGFTEKRIWWGSKIHHQGNDFWADQENVDPILGLVCFGFL